MGRIKQINADKGFVFALRKAKKKTEERFGTKISDSKATEIITPFIDRIFNPMDDLDDEGEKKKFKNLFKF